MSYLAFSLFGDWAGVAKGAEWIGAIFAGLTWAFYHPSTAAWVLGAGMIFAVFRDGWPFKGVPEITTFLGKAIVTTGLVLIVGGFSWRAADEVFGSHSVRTSIKQSQQQVHPTPEQRGSQGQDKPAEFTPNGG